MIDETNIQQLLDEAWTKRREGNYAEARALVQQAQAFCTEDNPLMLGRVFHIYMQLESDHDRPDRALKFCQQSLEYYKKSGNPDRIAHSTRHVAGLQRHLGQAAEAELNYREAIALYRSTAGTRKGDLANALRGFAMLLEELGTAEEAIPVWKEIKALYLACHLQEGVEEADHRLDILQR